MIIKNKEDILNECIEKLHESDQPYIDERVYDGVSYPIFDAMDAHAKQMVFAFFECMNKETNNPEYNDIIFEDFIKKLG